MTFPSDVPVLTDGTVTLRAHRLEDAPAVVEQCTDPVSIRWTTVPQPYTLADAEGFITERVPAAWATRGWVFAVEAPDDDGTPRFCGTVELRDEGDGRAEVAYGSHPWARGRGIITRAVRLLLDWGFDERGLQTVVWWANRGNWASRRLAWRLGFSCDGTVSGWLPQRGELLDGWVGTLGAGAPREPRHPWLEAPVIHGEHVVLRPHEQRDVVRLREAGDDPGTQFWLQHFAAPFTPEAAQHYLDTRWELEATGRGVAWTVADPVSDEPLSFLCIFAIRPGHEAEIGYFTHPDARGRGGTKQGFALAVRHAFVPAEDGGLGLRRLRLQTTERNAGSRALAEGAGFTLVGKERNTTAMRDGSLIDAVVYDLLVEEYVAR
ncbi:MAG: GNAT family N-acetyltransferase [Nocardioidaceae bacterium]